jgi:twitching motility protein PilJ
MSSGVKKAKTGQNAKATQAMKALPAYWHRTASIFGDPSRSKKWMTIGLISLIVTLLAFGVLFYNVPRSNTLIKDVGELRVMSQQVAKNATEAAVGGNDEAFVNLKNSQKQFSERLDNVHEIYGETASDIQAVDKTWAGINAKVNDIITNQQTVKDLHDLGIAISEVIPEMQAEYNSIVDGMVRAGAPASQVALAKNQVLLSERILRSINTVLAGDESSVSSADDFSSDAEDFGRILDGQLNGDASLGVLRLDDPELRASLESVKASYDEVIRSASSKILVSSPQIYQVRESSSKLFVESATLLNNLTVLSNSVSSSLRNLVPGLVMLLGLGFFAYSLWRLFIMRSRLDQERALQEAQRQRREAEAEAERARQMQDESDRNQNAILRLLDEIADLADGDLRSYATVSEDFTGAIADSINFAIDQLRDLVSRITETSQEVAQYTASTQGITNQLAEASEHQAQEIAGASAAINEMAMSIDQVSSNAEESAVVAERSVKIAANGADVVNRSIEGMDIIREQIQETSKRIKRLGESSQEIGNIVALINDIADQTNILALNAAIQASMAGEAGRGFAVVADEVQRLAERSASATKQIETLVKTIQTDTNEAVISMEQTTSEVVRGANLSKDAGVALDEIQNVSGNLGEIDCKHFGCCKASSLRLQVILQHDECRTRNYLTNHRKINWLNQKVGVWR